MTSMSEHYNDIFMLINNGYLDLTYLVPLRAC